MSTATASNPTNLDNYDIENGFQTNYTDVAICKFGSITKRNYFVRKVFCNLTIMLSLTALSCYAFMTQPNLKDFSQSRSGVNLQWLSIAILFGTIFTIICCDSIAKSYPYDYIILSIFTIAQSYLLGTACNNYSPNIVILAGGACLGITFALMLFAFQTKYDCTGAAGFMFALLTGLIIVNIINYFVKSSTVQLVSACAGVFIWSGYIIIDVQMIVGGKHHKYQFEEDEHVFATINLYLDIINLFLSILELLSGNRDN